MASSDWTGLVEMDPDDAAPPPPEFGTSVGEDDHEEGEGGFADARNLIRIWLDDDGLIRKVRLSMKWHDKLGSWRGLEHAFGEAFGQIALSQLPSIEVPDEAELQAGVPGPSPQDLARARTQRLTWDYLNAHIRRTNELVAELDQLPEEANGTWHASGCVGRSPDRSVAITLRPDGSLESISLDDDLLAGSMMRDLEASIIAAHKDARARFRPPTREPGDRDRLIEQFGAHREELVALLLTP